MNDKKSSMDDAQIEKLVKKSQKGEKEAFALLYDELITPIYRYIFYKVKREDVEDLTEVLFLKAWENIRKYKKRKNTTFKSWVFRIAHNLVIDHYRVTREHAGLDPRLSDTSRDADPVFIAKNSLNNTYLKEAVSKLKENYRQIVILKFVNELSNEEISKILKKSIGSVRILQFRALKSLKEILNERGITEFE